MVYARSTIKISPVMPFPSLGLIRSFPLREALPRFCIKIVDFTVRYKQIIQV